MTTKKTKPSVPNLRFPEFKDAPEWQNSTIGNRCESFSGGTPDTSKAHYYGGTIPFIRSAEIGSDETELFLTKEGLDNSAAKMVKRGDVLVALYGANSGDTALARIEGAVNQAILCLRSNESAQFLYHYLTARKNWIIATYLQGGQGNLSGQIVLSVPLSIPRRDEQERVADCLGSLDDLIAAEGRKLEALRQYKQGLMQQLFPQPGETRPRLRFPEFNDAPDWEATNLEEIVEFQSGSTPSKSNSGFWNGSIPWVSAKDMKRLFLDDAEDYISPAAVEDGARTVQAGSLLMLTRGMTLLKDVPICVLRREMSFNQDVKALLPKDNVNGLFLAFLLLRNKHRLLKMVDISGHGTGKLNTGVLSTLDLVHPQPPEQQRIAECLSALDTQISSQTEKLVVIRTHKQGLMQQLFPSPKAGKRGNA